MMKDSELCPKNVQNTVMNVLENLHRPGKGKWKIVSHVQMLRERIPAPDSSGTCDKGPKSKCVVRL